MKVFIFFLIFLCSLSNASFSANKTGANFLNMSVGARPTAMGEAFVASTEDIHSLWWNPAAIATLEQTEASFMYNDLGEDIKYQFMAYGRPLRSLNSYIGSYVSYLTVSDIQGYSPEGIATEDISTYGLVAAMVYGININNNLAAGISTKFIKEELDDKNAATAAFDIASLWKSPIQGLNFGVNIQNIGKGIKFIEERSPLPLNYKTGLSYSALLYGNELLLNSDFNIPSGANTYLCAGAELKFFNLVAIRAGFKSKDDLASGLRLGGGLSGNNLTVDYAWLPRGDFQDSHRFSLSLKFGKIFLEKQIEKDIDLTFQKGIKYYNSGKMLKAHNIFKSILLLAPRHKLAQDYLSRIEINIENAESSKEIKTTMTKGIELFEHGELIAAKTAFTKILTLKAEHTGAKNYIQKIDRRFSEVVDSFISSAITYFEQTEYEMALNHINRALALDPENKSAKNYLDKIRQKQTELNEIKKSLKKQQNDRIQKRKRLNLINKAEIHIEKKQWKAAIREYKKVLLLDKTDNNSKKRLARAYYNNALELQKDKEFIKALEQLEQAINLDSTDNNIKKQRKELIDNMKLIAKDFSRQGLKAYSTGKIKAALNYWKMALQFDPELESAQKNIERIQQELKK